MALNENTPQPLEAVGGYPRRPDGSIDLARLAGELCHDLNSLGERIDACNSHLAYLDELMPPRGEQRDEFDQLCTHVQWMHDALCTADERLVTAYRLIDHRQNAAT